MGATDGGVLRIFLYQGGLIGFAGTSLGLLLGLFMCKVLLVYGFPLDPKVYFISRLPVMVRWQEFLITGQCALAICLDATILPALHAANMDPAEGLRDQLDTDTSTRSYGGLTTAWLFWLHSNCVAAAVLIVIAIELRGSTFWLSSARAQLIALALFALGAASFLGLLLRRRWGLYGALVFWGAQIGGFQLLFKNRLITMIDSGVLVVVCAITLLALRKHWKHLH